MGRRLILLGLLVAGVLTGAAPAAPRNDNTGSFDPHRVLVAFVPGTPGAQRAGAHAQERGRVENSLDWLNLDVVRLPDNQNPLAAAARYEHNPNVLYAEPNWEIPITSIPNDPRFRDEWGLNNTGQTGGAPDADIDAPEGWDAAFGAGSFPSSGGTRVGIVDTGIDTTHSDLAGKVAACAQATLGIGLVVNGRCMDDNGHGTHVAGTIAAVTNNGVGVAGVAPNSQLAIFKALNAGGVGLAADIIAGIHWVHTTGGARVISMSFGGGQTSAENAELNEAYAAGTLLVAAAGNDGNGTLNWPAAHPNVVSVAATDSRDAHASFSNCNSDVEVAAPGVGVWSTYLANGYSSLSGTSMATPHVAGVGAMIMWKKGLNNAGARDRLKSTSDDLGPGGFDTCFGYGRVNLAKALGP
jgi:thermitase